ncbi:MAG: response regulator [Treponema sp.]|nr:response regulator [Treponema sp.]
MKIIALDDEYLGLEGLKAAIKEAVPSAEVHDFQDCDKALQDAATFIPEVAFLDIELRTKSGIEVAKELKKINSQINIIFVTGYSHYMKDAFDLYASGYVLKPVMSNKIKEEIEHLRFPVCDKKRICVHTFGTFEIFGDGVPLSFTYTKTKEMFALLVDAKGVSLSLEKIAEILWDNVSTDRRPYIRNLIADIRKVLRQYDAEDLIIRSHNNISIDVSKIDCDYYDFTNRKPEALSAFEGEYMSQYEWAKNTKKKLKSQK